MRSKIISRSVASERRLPWQGFPNPCAAASSRGVSVTIHTNPGQRDRRDARRDAGHDAWPRCTWLSILVRAHGQVPIEIATGTPRHKGSETLATNCGVPSSLPHSQVSPSSDVLDVATHLQRQEKLGELTRPAVECQGDAIDVACFIT